MKKYLLYSILPVAGLLGLYGFKEMPVGHTAQKKASSIPKDSVIKLIKEGYIYAYPIVQTYRTFIAAADKSSKTFRLSNKFFYLDKLIVATNDNAQQKAALSKTKNRTGAGPNNDTPYFGTWLDLSEGPVVLHIPTHGSRYFSLQFVDFFQDNVAYIGTRNGDITEARYLLAGPGWKGDLPAGIKKLVRFPANYISIIGRTLVDDDKDLPAVNALQHAITLTPLNQWPSAEGTYTGFVNNNLPTYYDSPDSFIVNLNNALQLAPPHAYDNAILKKLSAIGIGKKGSFDWSSQQLITAGEIGDAIATADRDIENAVPRNFVDAGNNWTRTPKDYGRFGTNYLLKAANIRMGGWGGHSEEEAFYLFPKYDDQGDSLSGDHAYLVHFNKGQLPPVSKDGFWSITAYEMPGFLLIPNKLNRYAIRDRTKGLKYNKDGSLDIYIQADSPGEEKESNWLPVSKESFTFCQRVYLPKEELLKGAYKLPKVVRLN